MAMYKIRPQGPTSDNPLDALPGRNSRYGERYGLVPGAGSNWVFADEGSYFAASNATVGTGIAGHAAPVVADTDTKALLALYNGGSRTIVPDFIFLEVTAAGTAGTLHYSVVYVDSKGSTARSSGGTQLTPVSTNSGNPFATGAEVYFGAVVTAMSNSKKVSQQIVREVIPVVQDTVMVVFGSPNAGFRAGLTTAGTATNHAVQYMPPIAIEPGGNFNFSQIRPSQSAAASYQVTFGYWER